ncbi:MAG: ribonuclease P protein component [Bacteroidales bacterium]|jgi:ribonuclease P protein component|nr:ribonuclease P protein component [Bacteroidales bacterium]MDD4703428.1 ribonuclease P protein component [Bacteroidales bacterium]MDX9797741.1 ribonuclease P protein component [Bacteroidales bacterium]
MHRFRKSERQFFNFEINSLFSSDKGFLLFPLSVKYNFKESEAPKVKVLIISPKRYQKLSVNRNRVKRLIRESYRLSSNEIKDFAIRSKIDIVFSFSFVSYKMKDFNSINDVVCKSLNRIINELLETIENDNKTI